MDKRRCIRCKSMFQPKRSTARYCGDKCASAERSKRYRARHSDPIPLIAKKIVCEVCEKEVLVLSKPGGNETIYCGEDCKKTAEKVKKAAD